MKVQEEYTRLFHYCLYRLGSREDAEDAVQETFLRYLQHPEYHLPGGERKCLYTIARNICTDMNRKTPTVPLNEELTRNPSDNITENVALRLAMEKLTEEEREIIILRLVNGEPIYVIAGLFGVSRFTMSRRIKSIQRPPKDMLGKENWYE